MFQSSFLRVRLAYKWQVTIAVMLGMFMSLLDMTIVNLAIPPMQHAFGADIRLVQWVVTIYMLTQAAVIPTAPYLGARFGEKRAYLWSLIAFLFGSLLCGFAWNLPSLILFRLIQGIGGGILLPLVMTLTYQAFPPEERGTASSAIGGPMMLAMVLGPVFGGFLVFSFGWQWAFWINVPVGIVAIALASSLLRPASSKSQTDFDLSGFLTAAAGCAVLVYAFSAIASGDAALSNLVLLGTGLLLLLGFVAIEWGKVHRGREPLLDVRRFTDPAFAWSGLALVCFSAVLFGLLFLIPVYLQTLRHETAFQSGMIQAAQALATVLILPVGGRLSDKVGPRLIALLGLTLMLAATAAMMTLSLHTSIGMIVSILFLLGCGNGLAQQIPVSAMARIATEEQREVANGSTLITVLRAIAAPVGVALFASLAQVQRQAGRAASPPPSEAFIEHSALLALHASFLLATALAAVALGVMLLVPRSRKQPIDALPRQVAVRLPEEEEVLSR